MYLKKKDMPRYTKRIKTKEDSSAGKNEKDMLSRRLAAIVNVIQVSFTIIGISTAFTA